MRIIRFLFVTLLTSIALAPAAARATDVEPVDYIVNSQVVSDEVNASAMPSDDLGGCQDDSGNCQSVLDSSASGLGYVSGGLRHGGVRGRLASAASYVGDIARGEYATGGTDGCIPRTYGYPDLFYNFYTQGNCNATNAQMYISPVPVPPNVGHTFYTYQPFMPHEMLYWHTDRYHNYYDGGRGMNHTKVHYFSPPIRQATSNFYWNHLRIPR